MINQVVVGLFDSKGEADNAAHRLVSEGIPQSAVSVSVLRETGPVPKTMEPELDTKRMNPFDWLFGALGDDYLDEITNGESVVMVEVKTDPEADAATSILGMFEPKRIDLVPSPSH